MIFSVLDPRVWVVCAAGMLIAFASGWGWCGYRHAVADAESAGAAKTAVEVVEKTVTVTDKSAVNALKTKLAAAQRRADDLQRRIEEARNAAPVSVADCRLPDGLRDEINRDLAASGSGGVDGKVSGRDR